MTDVITPKVRSAENMVRRARGATRDPKSPACPVCHARMWISFFFDGTGNHREKDFPVRHSNVAALFDAHENDPDNGVIALYYEGLGREFRFDERYEEFRAPVRNGVRKVVREGYQEEDGRALGLGFADGITERLEKAVFEFADRVDLMRSLRRVDEINLAAFGFSRGATEARAFMHWLAVHSKVTRSGNQLRYDGVPLNIKFLGIFDTVESVGGAGVNRLPELIKTTVPAFVERCTHIVAAHELRAAFPLTVVDGHRRCIVYPGAHADIGGGYEAGEQGRSDKLARIALLNMLDEARGAGLKMMSLGELKQNARWDDRFKPSFDIPQPDIDALTRFMQVVRPSGSVHAHFEAHMTQYWRWIDAGLAIEDARENQAAARAANDRARMEDARIQQHLLRNLARTRTGRGGPRNDSTPTVDPAVEHLFENYAHDSFEHFSLSGGTAMTDMSIADYYKIRTLSPPSG